MKSDQVPKNIEGQEALERPTYYKSKNYSLQCSHNGENFKSLGKWRPSSCHNNVMYLKLLKRHL